MPKPASPALGAPLSTDDVLDAFDPAALAASPSRSRVRSCICNDTHVMPATGFMCTSCPTPCEECRSRGPGRAGGPYCATTPCVCTCHRSGKVLEWLRGKFAGKKGAR